MSNKERPGALTPWSALNCLLKPEERFAIESLPFMGYLLAPKDISRLSAAIFLCTQLHLAILIELPDNEWFDSAQCKDVQEEFVVLSLRNIKRVETLDITNGLVGVEGGCSLRELDSILFVEGQELGLADWIANGDGKASIGRTIAAGVCSGMLLQGKSAALRIVGLEIVKSDGGRVALGGASLSAMAGPGLYRLLWGSRGRLGIITYACFQILPIPVTRLRLTWHFLARDALFTHLATLSQFSSTWERLDAVIPGSKEQKGFILAQISGSEEEMQAFAQYCPGFSSAVQEDYIAKLRTFFQKQHYFWRRLQSQTTIEDSLLIPGYYVWWHALTRTAWHLTPNSQTHSLHAIAHPAWMLQLQKIIDPQQKFIERF